MLCLLLTATLLATSCATKVPTNTTLLQSQFHGSELAINRSATLWFEKLHDQVPSQNPGVAAALSKLSLDDFRTAVLALAQRNITINSPMCASDSHLPIRKCLGRSNKTASRDVRSIVNAQKRACKNGVSSLLNWSFERTVSKCFDPRNSACAVQAPACIQGLAQDSDTQLLTMLKPHPLLRKRDNVSSHDNGNYTALQRDNKKRATDLTIVAAIGDAFAFLFFMANPITETFIPFVFLTIGLGFAADFLHHS
jgi:hypothetical protein